MGTYGGPNLNDDRSNLLIHLDKHNPKLDGSGRDIIRGTDHSVTISNNIISVPELDLGASPDSVESLTVALWMEVNGYSTGYAYQPFYKWNSGTNSAVMTFYAFQDYRDGGVGTAGDGLGNDDHNRYGFYYHRSGSSWTGTAISEYSSLTGGSSERLNFPRKNFFALTYDINENSSAPRIFCNGEYSHNGPAAVNGLGNGDFTQNGVGINTSTNAGGSTDNGITYLQVYDKYLTDDEINNIYEQTKIYHGY
jgi:hypothetical protein